MEGFAFRRPLVAHRAPFAACPSPPQGRQAARDEPGGAHRHLVRAQDGAAVGVLACRDGVRVRHVVLAAAALVAAGRRVVCPAPGAAGAHGSCRQLDWSRASLDSTSVPAKKGGPATGPNPTDRGKPGTKRHLVVDGRGTPLGVTLTGANRHDSMTLVPTLDAIPSVRSGKRGRPRRRPAKLHADKAYDHRRCRRECRERGMACAAERNRKAA